MPNILNELYEAVTHRSNAREEGSYTWYLFEKGLDKILKKCGEEATEMIIAAKNNDNHELKNEIADLLYHIMVLCVKQGLDWDDVEQVLKERRAKLSNLKEIKIIDKNT